MDGEGAKLVVSSVLCYTEYQPCNSSCVWQQCRVWLYKASAPWYILFTVCQAPSAEYTPGCLLTQQSGIHSHTLCTCLQDKSMRACLVGDNSLFICLCVIVVLWPQSLHGAGVWWGLLLVDLVQLSHSACSCTHVCCLLRCGSVVSSATRIKCALSSKRVQQYFVCFIPMSALDFFYLNKLF